MAQYHNIESTTLHDNKLISQSDSVHRFTSLAIYFALYRKSPKLLHTQTRSCTTVQPPTPNQALLIAFAPVK